MAQVQAIREVTCAVNYNGKCVKSEFFVLETVRCPLLDLPEIVALDILNKQCINTVNNCLFRPVSPIISTA